MAGPSVAVRVLADLSSFGKSFQSAASTAQSGISKIHGAFSGLTSTLNATGVLGPFTGAIAGADAAMQALEGHGKSVSTIMLGAGAGIAAAGAGLQALGSKERASHQQLQQAIEATGKDYEDYGRGIESAVKHMENFGFSADKTNDALRILTQATHDPQKALDFLGTTANIAKAKHEDLSEAATSIARVFNGNTRILKEYGIQVDAGQKKSGDYSGALKQLADVTSGQAAAATNTFSGHIDALKAKMEDAAAGFGQKYGPAVTAFGAALAGLGAAMQVISALGPVMGAALDIALGPIGLIILAIAALAVAAYAIYRNWDTIWGGMKAIVMDVWNWIRNNWPLLVSIIFGPVGLAVALIIKNFDTLKQAGLDVLNFFRSTIWQGIADAFHDTANFIIRIWNDSLGKVHFKIPSWVPFLGGNEFGFPHITPLATGGIVTSPTLAMIGESGPEAVVPLGRGGLGPVISIQNAQFNDPVDVELLSKKLTFAMSAGLAV